MPAHTHPRTEIALQPDAEPTTPDMAAAAGDPRPRAAVQALGCRLNGAEADLIRRQLEGAGYRVVPWGEPAEVCIVNTCTVTRQADAKSRQLLRAARRDNPDATVAVTGCYAQRSPQVLARQGLADLVVGNGEKAHLVAHLPTPGASSPLHEGPQVIAPSLSRAPFEVPGFDAGDLLTTDSGTRAHLKIQDGCDFMCTFCVIPAVRGRARPRALADLCAEAEALVAAGVREVVLTGVNLGTYSVEGPPPADLVTVVDALAEAFRTAPAPVRLRISSIEPTTVAEGLLERMADAAHPLVPFLHLPLQSGSAAVLEAMRRRYGPDDYRRQAEDALTRVPDLCLGTDVMVGFPGETDEAFGETLALLEGLPFAYAHVFPYSERPGTPAPRLPGSVPAPVRRRRAAVVRALSDSKRTEFHRRFVGRTVPVLFERPKTPGLTEGYTPHFVRVQVRLEDAAHAEALRNRIVPVRLLEAGASRVAGALAEETVPGRCG